MPPALGPELPRVADETAPKIGRSRVTSHLVRIEICCSARGQVGQASSANALSSLGTGRIVASTPPRHEFGLQPSCNPILLVGRKGRQLEKTFRAPESCLKNTLWKAAEQAVAALVGGASKKNRDRSGFSGHTRSVPRSRESGGKDLVREGN